MKKFRMLAVLAACWLGSAYAALNPGDSAPAFTAQASFNGKAASYSLRDALAKGPVVVYFYPSAFTNGCNLQAHLFSEGSAKFAAAGATVVGVSLDSIERLNAFSADPKYCAGKVRVASDHDGGIAKAFDLSLRDVAPGKKDTRGDEIDHATVERTSFVIDTDGKIVATISGLPAADNVAKSLEVIEALAAEKKSSR